MNTTVNKTEQQFKKTRKKTKQKKLRRTEQKLDNSA